jgi:DNA-binding protein HU-beta
MNKYCLFDDIYKSLDATHTRDAITDIVNTTFETIKKMLLNGDEISINGFGIITVVNVPQKKGRNPTNGETIIIPPSKKIKLKVSKVFKDTLNGKRAPSKIAKKSTKIKIKIK